MIADLYLCWAHYYDYLDNFEKAESVYRKGLDARAQPIELLEQAHRQFGFSMSQRILYKDESTKREIRSTMDEQRLALTSLRAHKHRHVGSIRTGSAVKSYNPGRVDQHGASASSSRNPRLKDNRNIQVFEDNGDEPTSPIQSSTSVVQSIINSNKKQENMREPGPWNKAKIKSHALFSGTSSTKPSFPILEDDNLPLPIPLAEKDNNYARGIQLPVDFIRQNLPQEEFLFPLHRDDEAGKNTTYKYDKFMVFPTADKCYSLEELYAYKWFKKNNIKNNFTQTQATVWENGYGNAIRLPPHFARKNRKQDDWHPSPFNHMDDIANSQRRFGFDINLLYTENGEFSHEEILQSKWLNGELMSQRDAEMEITCGFERLEEVYNRNAKRRSMILGGRKSILPRKSFSPRKSINVARKSITPTEQQTSPSVPEKEPEPTASNAVSVPTGAVKRTGLPKRKSVYMPKTLETLQTIQETASPPILRRKLNETEENVESHHRPVVSKFNIFEDNEAEADDNMFKMPHAVPAQKSAFQEDLDGCTTQTFNFFIKSQSISTPKVAKQSAKLGESDSAVSKGLDFGSDSDATPPSQEEPSTGPIKQPFACRLGDMEQQYVLADAPEIYRQKLSAIMETTEDGATISSAATASSKSSSAEDFDFTKNTNQQSSVAMSTYRHHTIVNSTAKMSSSNISTVNRENESRKVSAIGFEIYQEDAPKVNESKKSILGSEIYQEDAPKTNESKKTSALGFEIHQDEAPRINESVPAVNVTAKPVDVSKPLELPRESNIAFDKTLPPAGQFHIYEDETAEKPQTAEVQAKKNTSVLVKANETAKCTDKSVFNISQTETEPSNWSSKTLTNNQTTSTHRVSTVQEKFEKPADMTMTSSTAIIPSFPHKPFFQMMQEDTGLTIAPINIAEEYTEQIPNFNANRTNFTQQIPPAPEHPSIYMPELPEDTKNMSKYLKGNASRDEQPSLPPPPQLPASNDQSIVNNRSVFVMPKEDALTDVFAANFDKTETAQKLPNTNMNMVKPPASIDTSIFMLPKEDALTDVFATNFDKTETAPKPLIANVSMVKPPASNDRSMFMLPKEDGLTDVFSTNLIQERTETVPKLPNTDVSMVAIGNLSAFPMIPEMPTLPDIDFAAELPKNVSILNNKSQVMNRTKMETIDSTKPDMDIFKTKDKLPDRTIGEFINYEAAPSANLTTGIKENSFHHKDDRLSIWNKTGMCCM